MIIIKLKSHFYTLISCTLHVCLFIPIVVFQQLEKKKLQKEKNPN